MAQERLSRAGVSVDFTATNKDRSLLEGTSPACAPYRRAQEWWDDEEGAEAGDGGRPASAKRSKKQRGQQAPAARNWWESDDEEAADGSGADPSGEHSQLPASSIACFTVNLALTSFLGCWCNTNMRCMTHQLARLCHESSCAL